MKNCFYMATFFSCGVILYQSGSLQAVQSMITSPNAPSTQQNSSAEELPLQSYSEANKKGPETEQQRQMPAWLIESNQAAKDYVEGLDKEQYSQSWSKGDELFQKIVAQDEWSKMLNISRKRLGKANARRGKLQQPTSNPPGLPQGAYMVIEYETSFENAPQSIERLTLRRGNDGKWRVLTYHVAS